MSAASVLPTQLAVDHEGLTLTGPGGAVQADVCPAAGGEVSGLRLQGLGEVLYGANQFEPPPEGQWRGRAPLLWPAVGRNFTPAALQQPEPPCGFDHDGRHYPLPIHGFARDLVWRPFAQGSDASASWVRLQVTDDEATRAVYPWPFALEVEHRAEADRLVSTVSLTSTETIPFGIGNHLTVTIPPATFGEAKLRANVSCQYLLAPSNLLSGETVPAELDEPQPLAERRWLNTVLGGIEGLPELTLWWPDGQAITVSQEVVDGAGLVSPDDVLFVLYGNPELGYFCPEPWIGKPNGLQDPVGRVTLPAGKTFTWRMTIRIGA